MKSLPILVACVGLCASPTQSQLDTWAEQLRVESIMGVDDREAVAGLREALYLGSENAVLETGRLDGYFENEVIKILLPENFEIIERALRLVGQGDLVDEFILSMNRAAESAAPHAKEIFWGAIRRIDFRDAGEILTGGDTAATEYFREETSEALAEAFLPVVRRATDEVGATRKYKELVGRYQSIPFSQELTFDLDLYVVEKGLDGLFYILAEEERRIRTDPAARITEILRRVFSS